MAATAIANSFSARDVLERLVIDHVGHRGDGVAFVNGRPIYVPYALGGETVEVADVPGHRDRRRLLSVETASPNRIMAFCPHFTVCGGCAIQHWKMEHYRVWKRDLVLQTLSHAKLECEIAKLIDAHGKGRRRITLHAWMGTHEVVKVGYAAASSHDIIPIDRCPILDPGLDGALEAAHALAEPLMSVGKPLDIQITATDSGLDIDIRGSGPLQPKMITALSRIAEKHRVARLTRHGDLVLLRASPRVVIGAASVSLPPGSFLQATLAGEEALAALVKNHCGRAKTIADLFCGVGPFALRLAEHAWIAAFDGDAKAIDALQRAAHSPGLKPVKAKTRDLFRRPLVPQELRDYDVVVFDPPRQGALAQAQRLAASVVPVVVAVSCNAATFVRDARILVDGGYRLEAVTPVDQFRHTPHVELVARFKR